MVEVFLAYLLDYVALICLQHTNFLLICHSLWMPQFMRLAYLIGYGVEIEKSPVNRYKINTYVSFTESTFSLDS